MTDKAWKKFERTVARWFGSERTGPMQPKDANDINHDVIHAQCKHSKRFALLSVWDAAKKVAQQDDKIPIVAIKQKGRHGWWIFCHCDDLTTVANQRILAKRDGAE